MKNPARSFLTTVSLILALFAAALTAPAPVLADEVSARVETVTIPTFTIGPGDPAPSIFETGDWYSAYPRTMLDVATRSEEPVDKEYRMAVLENSHIRVEVLPAVGGHVWRIFDKKTQRDLLWTNDSVKPVRVGRRRGWLAGGIEFPFPVGNHGEDTMDPYRWKLTTGEDGSGTVTVSSFDHFYRFWGSYDITVRPDDARMAITVRLYNPTLVRNRYQLWINAAVETNEEMQYVFPVDYVTGHGFGGVYDWPNMGKEEDQSYWKNVPGQLGVFAWDADFLGAYYHDSDYGIIRYSSHDFTRGIKLWTWGSDSARWTAEYSMGKGPYGEIQGGRWPTQSMYGWLEPHQMDTWTEYWYPVSGLGGVDQASAYAAMKVNVVGDPAGSKIAEISLNALTPVEGRLVATAGEKQLLSKPLKLEPSGLVSEKVDISALAEDGSFNVSVYDRNGLSLISHDVEITKTRGSEPGEPSNVQVEGTGPEWEAFAEALALELNEGYAAGARSDYEALTEEYPGFLPAWKALGILAYRQMDYVAAENALAAAVKLSAADPEALYYLGLAKLALGADDAMDTLRKVSGDVRFTHMAKFLFGVDALREGHYAAAVSLFEAAGDGWSRDAVLWDNLAIAARLAGQADTAAQARAAALAAEPLDAFAMVESLFAADEATPEALAEAIGPDGDLYVETALLYSGLGLDKAALAVAKAGEPLAEGGLYYYYLAYLAKKAGDPAAGDYAAKASSMGTAYVFPHRPEAVAVMESVGGWSGDEGYPKYHAGTMLYWLGRTEDALETWESLIGKYDLPGLYRNVAKAYTQGRFSAVYKSAIDLYQKAVAEDPGDVELYYALDDLYNESGDRAGRRDIIEKGRELFPEDDQMALRAVLMALERGGRSGRGAGQAREILESHQWHRAHQSYELMRLAHRAITETYVSLAVQALGRDNKERALEMLEKAANAEETLHEWFD